MAARIQPVRQVLFIVLAAFLLSAVPAGAFTANSLDIVIGTNGDAMATFRFTLEGLVENAIPQSMLENELVKGMSAGPEPSELVSMDRSSATIRMKKFAYLKDVPTGTEYTTTSMNFKKAQIALENSGLSGVVSADFSPAKTTVTFPDQFSRQFSNSDVLPSITHTIIDPGRRLVAANATNASSLVVPAQPATGTLRILSTPDEVMVFLDGEPLGTAPDNFTEIAPGPHTLRFEKEQFAPATKAVNVTAGQTVRVSVFLAYIQPTPQPSPGFAGIFGILALGLCLMICRKRQ